MHANAINYNRMLQLINVSNFCRGRLVPQMTKSTGFKCELLEPQVRTFVKVVERSTLDVRRIFQISPLEYSGIYYSS